MKTPLLLSFALLACSSTTPPPTGTIDDTGTAPADTAVVVDDTSTTDTMEAAVDPFVGCTKDPGAPMVDPTPIDPAMFTMDKATAGFPAGTGKWKAAITTELGVITCTFDDAAAPFTVANFIGLARGTRPYQDYKTMMWKVGRFYDGLTWHRVIPDFVVQGGDPRGTGYGGPGYDPLPVENHVEEPLGTLAMASTDETHPSGSQFYIVVGPFTDKLYNVFGSCDTDVAEAISMVPVVSKTSGKPKTPIHMQRIDIARCPS